MATAQKKNHPTVASQISSSYNTSVVQPDADIMASWVTAPPPSCQLPAQTLSLILDASRPLPLGSEDATRSCEKWHSALSERKKERRGGGMGGEGEYVCVVMLMSLQLHDCPLWPSVAPPAIDQGRVSRSLAALQCSPGQRRDEFISFSAAAVFAHGSGDVDGLLLCREGNTFW